MDLNGLCITLRLKCAMNKEDYKALQTVAAFVKKVYKKCKKSK